MANKNPIQFSVVVPVYNSEGSLKILYRRLSKVFASLNNRWELILVNDCSRDNSWNVMQELASDNQNVVAVNLTNNFGQHNAIMCGFSFARGKYVVTMDDDLQNPPEEIIKLAKTIIDGNYSVVYGLFTTCGYGLLRDYCSAFVHKIISNITSSGYTTSSFRIIEHSVVKKIIGFKQYNVMIDVLIKDIVGRRNIGHCRVENHPRTIGKSNYSFKKLFLHALNMIFNYTLWPLRFASMLGFLFSFLGIIMGVYSLLYYLFYGVSISGWTSIMIAITFFSGAILFVLGIIGEYIGRIFLNVNQKPQYFIKEIVSKRKEE